jgi:hypothetical protein
MFVETIVLPRREWERWHERLRLADDPPEALIASIAWDSGDGEVTGINVCRRRPLPTSSWSELGRSWRLRASHPTSPSDMASRSRSTSAPSSLRLRVSAARSHPSACGSSPARAASDRAPTRGYPARLRHAAVSARAAVLQTLDRDRLEGRRALAQPPRLAVLGRVVPALHRLKVFELQYHDSLRPPVAFEHGQLAARAMKRPPPAAIAAAAAAL